MRFLFLFTFSCSSVLCWISGDELSNKVDNFFAHSRHTNNWAVLVCSSRFWYNYRHVANVLSFYHSIKRLGIPDSNIIVMLADQIPCNPRNPDPATIYNNAYHHSNLFSEDVEVDYRGYEVSAENLVRLLTGRVLPSTPRNKKLLSDRQSNVLLYLSGHGGDGFLKFQDAEELTSVDLADAIETMFQHNRYNELFVISDTCQSESILVGEDSLSHHVDRSIGVYIIDRYPYYIQQFLEGRVRNLESNTSMAEYVKACGTSQCISTVGLRADLYEKPLDSVPVTDFFGSQRYIKKIDDALYSQEDLDFILAQ
uniref:GPI-anchor transamidase n=1 Tax=Ditylenchus dipsaci TaxID=166011 RepID=A0A915DFW1_9BILA